MSKFGFPAALRNMGYEMEKHMRSMHPGEFEKIMHQQSVLVARGGSFISRVYFESSLRVNKTSEAE